MTRCEQVGEPTLADALADYTGNLLRHAYRRARECADRVIPAPYRLRDVLILWLLDVGGPTSQRHLAELANINRTIMVKLVDDLERRGLLRRERDPHDRRAYALVPTETGLAALHALQPALDRGEAMFTSNLSQRERDRLADLLRAVLPTAESAGGVRGPAGYFISPAHHYVRARAVEVLGPLGLLPRQFALLAMLERDQPCTQQHLASWLAIGAAVALQIVDELDRAGLVSRTRNAEDRRAYDLRLTVTGQDRLDAARRALREVEAELAARLHQTDDGELRRLLSKLLASPSSG